MNLFKSKASTPAQNVPEVPKTRDLPRNITRSVSEDTYVLAVIMAALGTAMSAATIGVAAAAHVKFSNFRTNVENLVVAPNALRVYAYDIVPTNVVVIVFSCFICLFLLSTFIWLLCTRSDRPSRGFFTSGASLYIPAFVVFILSWLLFADLAAYSKFLNTGNVEYHLYVGGVEITPTPEKIKAIEAALLSISTRYNDYSFLRNVAIVGWISWFICLISSMILFMAAADGSEFVDTFAVVEPMPYMASRQISAPATATETAQGLSGVPVLIPSKKQVEQAGLQPSETKAEVPSAPVVGAPPVAAADSVNSTYSAQRDAPTSN